MKWNTEYFGFRLLAFVGFCGEVPVALLRKTGGCYDYRRRVVTELVRTGYLKERRFRGERQYHVRPGLGWFFDFQMPAIERLCNTGAELVSLPGSLLAGLDRKEGERNGS